MQAGPNLLPRAIDIANTHWHTVAMTNAQDIHKAMVDLRTGKITPDEFRKIMRASREQDGNHDQRKAIATGAFNRA